MAKEYGYKTFFYPDEILFIMKNYSTMRNHELLDKINENRITIKKLTLTLLRYKLYDLGLKRTEKPNNWTEIETNFLLENYQTKGNIEIAEILNSQENKSRIFNKKIIEKKMVLLKIKRSNEDLLLIKSNNILSGSYKHGKTGLAKKYPNGKIVIHNNLNYKTGKYYKRKVIFINGEQKAYARYVWEQHNGEILEGHKICFLDGDTMNCHITNLTMVKLSRFKRNISPKITTDFFSCQGTITKGQILLKEISITKLKAI